MLVIFDVLGTLFSFDKIKDGFLKNGIRQELADLWLARLIQCSMASALAGKYVEFNVLACSVLAQIFTREHIDERRIGSVLSSLRDIEPWEDAGECLHRLRADGHRLVALTNCCRADATSLLERAGLWKWFERLCSSETIRACKPHHALYEHLFRTLFAGPYDCCMVSAHGFDIVSAESLGMNSVYVSRLEGRWPFPEEPSGFSVSNLSEVPKVVSANFGKPAGAEEVAAGRKWYGEA